MDGMDKFHSDMAAINARVDQLIRENAELRASLKECVEYAERYEDSGPLGEGWQSKRLVNVCQHARALLARVEGK